MNAVFADVILPLRVPKPYTYAVSDDLADQAEPGRRAIVQFGAKHFYTGLIARVHQEPPEFEAKFVEAIPDDAPLIGSLHFKFWDWMARFYMCAPGEILLAALPAGLRLQSESLIVPGPASDAPPRDLAREERLILDAVLAQSQLSIMQIRELLGKATVEPVLKALASAHLISYREELAAGYQPKMIKVLRLATEFHEAEAQAQLQTDLSRAKKQWQALEAYLDLAPSFAAVEKQRLKDEAGVSAAVLAGLIAKEILVEEQVEVSRLVPATATEKEKTLTPAQQTALSAIQSAWKQTPVVLLHGVTSCGKTELYIRLIAQALTEGKTTLYLLPEIAITTQIIARLRAVFGDEVGVYHSRFNNNERIEVLEGIREGKFKVVVGARSALLAPVQNLGLVIVDEEHDGSYKQHDPAPRYQARDAATFLAHLYGAKCLLGSATPSLESMANAQSGRFGLVRLLDRYGETPTPSRQLVDLRDDGYVKQHGGTFSQALIDHIQACLQRNRQVLLFRNRRGYAPRLACGSCGDVPHCRNCDVGLTYHRTTDEMRCHYCNWRMPAITICRKCAAHNMRVEGFGTQKIEEEIALIFPDARIGRLDQDVSSRKDGIAKVLDMFDRGRLDILVGTQMISKGLDFGNIGLGAILDADLMLGFPDFRAHEKAFQLMLQISGRVGRRGEQGKVLIQTRNPDHPLLQWVIADDYEAFMQHEFAQRVATHYPPGTRLFMVHLRHRDRERTYNAGRFMYGQLRRLLGDAVLPPTVPVIPRIRNRFLMNLMIRTGRQAADHSLVRRALQEVLHKMSFDPGLKSVHAHVDVDPG